MSSTKGMTNRTKTISIANKERTGRKSGLLLSFVRQSVDFYHIDGDLRLVITLRRSYALLSKLTMILCSP